MPDPQRRLKATGWILVLVVTSFLVSCMDVPVHCSTTGASGSGPGGCGLDLKFDTRDTSGHAGWRSKPFALVRATAVTAEAIQGHRESRFGRPLKLRRVHWVRPEARGRGYLPDLDGGSPPCARPCFRDCARTSPREGCGSRPRESYCEPRRPRNDERQRHRRTRTSRPTGAGREPNGGRACPGSPISPCCPLAVKRRRRLPRRGRDRGSQRRAGQSDGLEDGGRRRQGRDRLLKDRRPAARRVGRCRNPRPLRRRARRSRALHWTEPASRPQAAGATLGQPRAIILILPSAKTPRSRSPAGSARFAF